MTTATKTPVVNPNSSKSLNQNGAINVLWEMDYLEHLKTGKQSPVRSNGKEYFILPCNDFYDEINETYNNLEVDPHYRSLVKFVKDDIMDMPFQGCHLVIKTKTGYIYRQSGFYIFEMLSGHSSVFPTFDFTYFEIDARYVKNKKVNVKRFLLSNGDITDNMTDTDTDDSLSSLIESDSEKNIHPFPTISFNCLRRLTRDKTIGSVAKRLSEGNLRVLDYGHDETIHMSEGEASKVEQVLWRNESPNPPKYGFTPIIDYACAYWHKPASVLFADKQSSGRNKYYLISQDEGTYFGVELPKAVKTLDEAFESLKPEHLRGRDDISRQGEWFIVPVDKNKVPDVNECAAMAESLILPKDDKTSSDHVISARMMANFSLNMVLVDKQGFVYARNFDVQHEDHRDLVHTGKTWHTFYHNLAKRSVSVDGVD